MENLPLKIIYNKFEFIILFKMIINSIYIVFYELFKFILFYFSFKILIIINAYIIKLHEIFTKI